MPGKVLNSQKIISTISTLHSRIVERFPDSGLSDVCKTLEEIAVNAAERANWIGKPILWLRVLVYMGCAIFATIGLFVAYYVMRPVLIKQQWTDLFKNVESEINLMILIGGATIFIWSLEKRYKRWRALQAIHELRSVAHVIDMHQLTKDPERITSQAANTSSSPEFKMTSYELRRYLDYCSEMLSLVGKVAALYVQKFDDPVALSAASEVESTSTGLSRKIWQKLLILHTIDAGDRNPPSSEISVD